MYNNWYFCLIIITGLNNDQWHSVAVRIDVHGTRLIAKVDKDNVETQIKGLNKSTNYGVSTDLTPVVLIGGKEEELVIILIYELINLC